MAKPRDMLDLDSILTELGQFGRYQMTTYCFILLPIVFSGIYKSQYIFNAAEVDYRCEVPECESVPVEFEIGEWGIWALPTANNNNRCERRKPVGKGCTSEAFHQNETIQCSSWIYANDHTISAEFDLACKDWRRTLVGTIHNAGVFAALPITGYISDRFGRRTVFLLTSVFAAVSGIIRSFSRSYLFYVIMEFTEATVGSGVYSTGFILALEMVDLDKRVLFGNIISISFALGQIILALVAWTIPYWRTLTLVLYAPSLLFIFYYFIIEESVRWLISRGNKKEAVKILFKAAALNKIELSPETMKQLSEDQPQTTDSMLLHPSLEKNRASFDKEKAKERSLTKQIFKSRILMSRVCVCSFWWISVTFIYYGLSINSVSLGGNSYVNYILSSLVEVPGYALSVITLDRFGRKSSIMTAFFFCGIALLVLPFIPNSTLSKTLTMAGKLSISMVFASVYIYTIELFPTRARQTLMGVCSMFGRLGSMLAPQTPLLMSYMASLPYIIFGVLAGCSGALMLLTPETLHVRLPDTVHQAERIAVAPRSNRRTDIIVD